jgi:hypothetical protein
LCRSTDHKSSICEPITLLKTTKLAQNLKKRLGNNTNSTLFDPPSQNT